MFSFLTPILKSVWPEQPVDLKAPEQPVDLKAPDQSVELKAMIERRYRHHEDIRKALVEEWYRQRRDTLGYREIASQTPGCAPLTLEVSTWLQVPCIFQKVTMGTFFTLTFPVTGDYADWLEQRDIYDFLQQNASATVRALLPSLEERIAASASFANLELRVDGKIKDAKEWISAHMLGPETFVVSDYPLSCSRADRGTAATDFPADSLLMPSQIAAARNVGDAVLCMGRFIPNKQIAPSELWNMEALGEGGEGVVLKSPKGTAYKLYTRRRSPAALGLGAKMDSLGPSPADIAKDRQVKSPQISSGRYNYLLFPALSFKDAPDNKNVAPEAPPATESSLVLAPLSADRSKDLKIKLSKLPIWLYDHLTLPISFLSFAERPDEVVGIEMPLVEGAVLFDQLINPAERRCLNLSLGTIASHFLTLYDLLWDLEQGQVIAGDLKFDNIFLLPNGALSLVDTDSLGVAEHPCHAFSEGYVDPQLCDPSLDREKLIKPPDGNAMWYSYTVMLFQGLVGAHPFMSGNHKPANGAPEVPDEARALKGISVFHPEVTLLQKFKDALKVLPSDLQLAFRKVFEEGARGRPRRDLIAQLVSEPTEAQKQYSPHLRSPWHLVSGSSDKTTKMQENIVCLDKPEDRVLGAKITGGKILSFSLSSYNSFKQEITEKFGADSSVGPIISFGKDIAVCSGADPAGKGATLDEGECWTWVNKHGDGAYGIPVSKSPFHEPNITVQDDKIVFINPQGDIYRALGRSSRKLGHIPGECSLFTGETFGLIFSTNKGTLMDTFLVSDNLKRIVGLPPIAGRVLGIDAKFSKNNAWVFIKTIPESAVVGYTFVIDRQGHLKGLNAKMLLSADPWFLDRQYCAYDIGLEGAPGLAALSFPGAVHRLRCNNGLNVVRYSETSLGKEGAPPILLADEKRLYGVW